MMHQHTLDTALDILTVIEDEPLTGNEICARWELSRPQWTTTYKPAIRELAANMGMRVSRPVPTDGYRYRSTDVWNNVDFDSIEDKKDPHIGQGYLFRLKDEITRRETSIDLLEHAMKKMDGRKTITTRLKFVLTQERACLASMHQAAHELGLELNGAS